MSSQRPSFAKREREQKLKDKARAKAERRAAKRAAKVGGTDAPPPVDTTSNDVVSMPAAPVPKDPSSP